MIGPAPGPAGGKAGHVSGRGRDRRDPGAASTELLRERLARLLARHRPGARIVDVGRSPGRYRSSWWLEDLRVTLEGDTVVEMVFKDLGRPTPGSSADRTKPRRVVDPGREPWVYRSVLEPLRSGAPSCWGSVSWPGHGRHWLFLERIAGVPLVEVGEPEAWEAAAAWLGRFHVTVGRGPASPGPLLRHDAWLHHWWYRRAVTWARETPGAGEDGDGRGALAATLRRIQRTHAAAVEEVADAPRTLIHGEFYPSNVLLEEGRIRPVDWEMAGIGPALIDLAALTSGSWTPEERAGMALAYRNAVLRAGAPVQPLDAFLRTLTACRLLLAVQWLGWGRSWEPPPEHRQDWLQEAVRCVEALEES